MTATSLIGLLSHAFDVASVSSELAVLIGLGVGVDYGLFIISRHRSAVQGRPVATTTPPPWPCGPPAARCCSPASPSASPCSASSRSASASSYGAVARRGHRGGPDHGRLPHLPAGHARLPRPQGPVPAGTARPWPPAARRARTPPASGSAGPASSKPARPLVAAGRPRRRGRDRPADLRPPAGHLRRQHRPGGLDHPPGLHRPGPRASAPGSTGRSNWPPRPARRPTPPPSAISWPPPRTRPGWRR